MGQKEKEDLDDVSGELELADEDETVPYVIITPYLIGSVERIFESVESLLTFSTGPVIKSATPLYHSHYQRFKSYWRGIQRRLNRTSKYWRASLEA